MEAGTRTLNDPTTGLIQSGLTLEIPFFQRGYVWEYDNWERFLKDMTTISNSSKNYFMGSVILQQLSTRLDEGDRRQVIDGQQRLTTILIFFKALYEIQDLDSTDLFLNIRGNMTLQHNHNDIEIFEAIIKGPLTDDLKDKYKENEVLLCYYFFLNTKREELKKIDRDEILKNLYFVGIDLDKDEDEQQIFDTINSSSVSLSVAELLKNELFKKADKELYKATWKETFEKNEDTRNFWDRDVVSMREKRTNIDLFLYAFLLIRTNGVKDEVGNLLSNYKKELKKVLGKEREKKEFIEELVTFAAIYQNNINPGYLDEDIDKDSSIERLNVLLFGLNTTTVVPYILYVLKCVEDKTEQKEIFSLLESYLIRRFVCRENTRGYNVVFSSFVKNGIDSFDKLREGLRKSKDSTNLFPHDKDFEEGFQKSELSNQQAKIILYLIEKSSQNGMEATALLPASKYTLEHMMPKEWENNWAANLSPEQIMERKDKRPHLKLGNLTIITGKLNSSIRNEAWQIKKEGKGNKKGLAFYSQGIKNMNECLKKGNWDEDGIEKRGEWLYDKAKEIWKDLTS